MEHHLFFLRYKNSALTCIPSGVLFFASASPLHQKSVAGQITKKRQGPKSDISFKVPAFYMLILGNSLLLNITVNLHANHIRQDKAGFSAGS
ncbi:MAG: hypothetical protein ABIK68_17670 [bacterium]